MGWSTTPDLDRFRDAAEGYLKSRGAENTLLLSAAQDARSGWPERAAGAPAPAGADPDDQADGDGLLFGWWEPWDGSDPRGAFVHHPAVPLLIAGRSPEMAAALAATLAKMGRQVSGVDAPVEVADAFAAAWSQRAGATVRVHRHSCVYRMAGIAVGQAAIAPAWASAAPATPGGPGGRLRAATVADHGLLADWVRAFGMEAGVRIARPDDAAAELISYGGAFFWEVTHKPKRLLDAAHYLAIPHHRETAAFGEPVYQPVAFVALSRPVAGTVRISMVYTLPERRRDGYAAAMVLAVSRAVLDRDAPAIPGAPGSPDSALPAAGAAREVVLVTDRNGPDRRVTRLGFQLVAERAVLRFGPPTAPLPKLRATGPMPRWPTGPLPRVRRLPVVGERHPGHRHVRRVRPVRVACFHALFHALEHQVGDVPRGPQVSRGGREGGRVVETDDHAGDGSA
jgi:hypothetical protein